MKRIVIVGVSGSGKTTLANKLSQKLNIPCYDLDEYYWLPNWQTREPDEFKNIINSLIQNDRWVISGNYSAVKNSIWEQADTIIWLDYSFMRCFSQALRRSIKRAFNKEPCCNGNYESFSRLFLSKDSILLWIINAYPRYKKEYPIYFAQKQYSNKQRFVFHNPQMLNKWLRHLEKINF